MLLSCKVFISKWAILSKSTQQNMRDFFTFGQTQVTDSHGMAAIASRHTN
jgi:hypothetical protein